MYEILNINLRNYLDTFSNLTAKNCGQLWHFSFSYFIYFSSFSICLSLAQHVKKVQRNLVAKVLPAAGRIWCPGCRETVKSLTQQIVLPQHRLDTFYCCAVIIVAIRMCQSETKQNINLFVCLFVKSCKGLKMNRLLQKSKRYSREAIIPKTISVYCFDWVNPEEATKQKGLWYNCVFPFSFLFVFCTHISLSLFVVLFEVKGILFISWVLGDVISLYANNSLPSDEVLSYHDGSPSVNRWKDTYTFSLFMCFATLTHLERLLSWLSLWWMWVLICGSQPSLHSILIFQWPAHCGL